MYKLRGVLFFILFAYSCTPNVNNTLPSSKVSSSPNIISSQSPKPTEFPAITPSITISTPSPNSTPRPIREIQKINVYSDDGTLINTGNEYKMILNETKTFKTEIVYKDGTVSTERVNWSSNNLNVNIIDSGKIETSLKNSLYAKSMITLSSEEDPNYKYSFYIYLFDTLTKQVPIYDVDGDCKLKGYKDEPISRYYIDLGVTPDIRERATFNGKVFDPNGVPVEGATVNTRAIDAGVNWVGEAQQTIGGAYLFRNAPVGARVLITVTKDGWTTRTRSEVLKSNLQGEPCLNVFNFRGIYAIQDEPEITMLKINGQEVKASSNGDIFNEDTNRPKNLKPSSFLLDNANQVDTFGNVPSLTGLNSNTLEIEMTFSESVKVDDVRNYFRIISQSTFNNKFGSFTIDSNYSGVEFVVSADEKTITFKTNKAILSNKEGQEARYLIDFSQPFRDKIDKAARDRRHFRFSNTQMNDFAVFSVKNDSTAPKLLGITARDGGSANDTIELKYSEPMELINQKSYTAGLTDSTEPLNLNRQLWYRDANDFKANTNPIANSIDDNNATLVGFLSGSDTDTSKFRASYMIGRILSSEISSITTSTVKTSVLGNINRLPNTNPVKGNTTANNLLRNARITGSSVLLEFSPDAFDRDDRLIVSVGKGIEGNFVDRNRTPAVNDDLRVITSVEYASIYDPAGRLIDAGDSTSSANIDVDNSQRVATVS